MGAKLKYKCLHCDLPVYAKHLCRRHYKKMLAIKNGTYKKDYEKRKKDAVFMEKKRMIDQIYREKKKLGINTTRKTNDNAMCNQDWRLYFKTWANSSENRKLTCARRQKKYLEYRINIINHYSNGKNCCSGCGIGDIRVLDIDHINNDGAKQRRDLKQNNLVWWIISNNFPTGYQILCRNCNWLKEMEKIERENDKKFI